MLKRVLVSAGVAVVVLGAVTGFAASLNVSSSGLGAGEATVAACNSSASVSYNVAFSGTQYIVTTAPVASASGCANKSYSVTLTNAGTALGTLTGSLDASGAASPDFTSLVIPAASVTGVSVAITG